MSLKYLKEAIAANDTEKLIRYVRLHFGDGDEAVGRKEIDKAWVEALKLLLDTPPTDREFILQTLAERDAATLAHLFFHLHFYFVQRSGEWIHDGQL
jgi:tRNA G37 N-methylase Trm5